MVALFVYGTLRLPAGGPAGDTRNHPHISGLITSAISGRLEGAELHDFGSYPGVYPGDGVVLGEILEMSERALVVTDRIERHPDFYTRRLERVCGGTHGDERDAWVYWAPAELYDTGSRVRSGDWLDRAGQADFASIDEQLVENTSRLEGEA
jgi:gamma-glutamylcyclotransferase (GGCT)/AIG2-like uncharacterized protein YtfP